MTGADKRRILVFMEKISKNPRKRGRPRLDDHGISDLLGSRLHTRRGKQNKYYLMQAVHALSNARSQYPLAVAGPQRMG